MLKILMCGNHPSNKGGMTSVINQVLVRDWKKEDIELTFVPTYLPGGKVKTILYFAIRYLKVFFLLLFKKPDVFYTHMSVRGSFSRTKALHGLCKRLGVPDVIHLHGSEFKDWYESETDKKKKKIRTLIEECSTFIVLGQQWEKYVSRIAPKANIVQIHNCIDIPRGVVSWGDKTAFLFLGVFIPRKGVIDLLRAVKLLADRGQLDNCEFRLGGSGVEENTLKEYVRKNGLDKYVHFLGWVTGEKKITAISNSNVFILPSYNEGLPISVLEAMSYGMPVISTRVGDIEDAVIEGENGFLINPGDVESLAERIVWMKDKQRWDRLSNGARSIAETRFDIMRFYERLSEVWKEAAK